LTVNNEAGIRIIPASFFVIGTAEIPCLHKRLLRGKVSKWRDKAAIGKQQELTAAVSKNKKHRIKKTI
jgi:hypothetical protein